MTPHPWIGLAGTLRRSLHPAAPTNHGVASAVGYSYGAASDNMGAGICVLADDGSVEEGWLSLFTPDDPAEARARLAGGTAGSQPASQADVGKPDARAKAIIDFIVVAFNNNELYRLVRNGPGGNLRVAMIPSPSVCGRDMAAAVVAAYAPDNPLILFDLMRQARPLRADEIDKLEARRE